MKADFKISVDPKEMSRLSIIGNPRAILLGFATNPINPYFKKDQSIIFSDKVFHLQLLIFNVFYLGINLQREAEFYDYGNKLSNFNQDAVAKSLGLKDWSLYQNDNNEKYYF